MAAGRRAGKAGGGGEEGAGLVAACLSRGVRKHPAQRHRGHRQWPRVAPPTPPAPTVLQPPRPPPGGATGVRTRRAWPPRRAAAAVRLCRRCMRGTRLTATATATARGAGCCGPPARLGPHRGGAATARNRGACGRGACRCRSLPPAPTARLDTRVPRARVHRRHGDGGVCVQYRWRADGDPELPVQLRLHIRVRHQVRHRACGVWLCGCVCVCVCGHTCVVWSHLRCVCEWSHVVCVAACVQRCVAGWLCGCVCSCVSAVWRCVHVCADVCVCADACVCVCE